MLFNEQEVKALTTKILSMTVADDATAGVGSNRNHTFDLPATMC